MTNALIEKPNTLMSVTVDRLVLQKALDIAVKAVPGRTPLPILTHFELSVRNGKLSVLGTDTEVWIEHTIPVENAPESSLLLPAQLLTNLVARQSGSTVTITGNEDGSAQVKSGKSSTKVLGLSSEDMPMIPNPIELKSFTIPVPMLSSAIKQTMFAASSDAARPVFCSVFMQSNADRLNFVSTDTHTVAVRTCDIDDRHGDEIHSIIPIESARRLLSILPDMGRVNVVIGNLQCVFTVTSANSETKFITRLIDGQFPAYERYFAPQFAGSLIFQRVEMVDALKRGALFDGITSKNILGRVTIELAEDMQSALLSTESQDTGKCAETLEIATEGAPVTAFALNPRYVLELLNALSCEGVRVSGNEELKPYVFTPVGQEDDYKCLIMPMQRK